MENLNKISITGIAGIRFTDEVISLWLHGLQADIHFSLSLNKMGSDINFHVTRETNADVVSGKPKNVVFIIAKELLKDLETDIAIGILRESLVELDINELQKQNGERIRFISNDDFEKSAVYSDFEKRFKEITDKTCKFQGKSVYRINNNIANACESLALNGIDPDEIIEQFSYLPSKMPPGVLNGMLLTDSGITSVIHYNNRWYTPKLGGTLTDLLASFLGKPLTKKIIYNTLRAIVTVKKANTFREIAHLNNPFRIIKRIPVTAKIEEEKSP